ncbi:MAG: hypothetical protein RL653_81 [Pseudomonadota bacterium]|jgi:hypothetical protein
MKNRSPFTWVLVLLSGCGGPVAVDSVSPASLSARGGAVTVQGRGFKPGMSAWVGESAVSADVKDERTAVLQVPVGRAGALDVRVRVGKDEDTLEDGVRLLPLELAFADLPGWSLPEVPGAVTNVATSVDGLLASGPFGAVLVRGGPAGWALAPLQGLGGEDGGMPPVTHLALQPSGTAGIACTEGTASPLHWLSTDDGPLRVAASSGAMPGRCLAVAAGPGRGERSAWVAFEGADGARTLRHWTSGEQAEAVPSPALPATVHALAVHDLDADGDEDVLVSGRDGPTARTEAWLQHDGGFISGPLLYRSTETRAAAVLDVDADGDLDILAAGAGADALWVNDGAGRFVDDAWRRLPFDRSEAHGMAVADLDLDGHVDVLLPVPDAMDRLLLARDGGFVDATTALGLQPGQGGVRVACVDLDLDGDLDVATALPDGGLRVRLSVEPLPEEAAP